MPTKNKNANEQTTNNFNDETNEVLTKAIVNNSVYVSCGVNRRVNLGNFEHLDIYAGVAMPIDANVEQITNDISDAIAQAMRIASLETNERYQAIKQAQSEAQGR
jgi:hypothetical protein